MTRTSKTVILLVLLWWTSNGLTSLFSKTEMSKPRNKKSFLEMKWLDLTIIQFLFGFMGSAFWLLFIEKRFLSIQMSRDWNDLVAIIGNLVGHLSVNVSYTFVTSSATQVVKSSEPIFMFLFLLCLPSRHVEKQNMNAYVLFSMILMVFGTCLFVLWDITFNVWGITAAVVSNIAFPLRNIALKNISERYQSPFQKYFMLSFSGILLLFPPLILKLIFENKSLFNLSPAGIAAASFHCIYNLASITVLQNASPLNHAILNFSKRIFVIALNIKYFHLNMTWHMFTGLAIVFSGLALYLFFKTPQSTSNSNMFLVSPFARITPRRYCRFFFFVGILSLLSTMVYLPPLNNSGKVNLNSVGQEIFLHAHMKRGVKEIITTAWAFNRPVSDAFIEAIIAASEENDAGIHVYCGTTKCMGIIKKLKNPEVTASFLVVPIVLGKTPLKEWGERHVLYKVLTGFHYEWYLTQAVCLAHLWQHGGRFYLPPYRIPERLSNTGNYPDELQDNDSPCISLRNVIKRNDSLKVAIAMPPKDQRVQRMMEKFLENMSWINFTTLPFVFQDTVWNAYVEHCANLRFSCLTRNPKSLRDLYAQQRVQFYDEPHFGALSLDSNVGRRNRGNIGDEIQSIAGIQFLPFLDFFLDRKFQIAPNTHGHHTVFFNSWWGNGRLKWPPSKNIDPIMLSVHTEQRFREVISSSPKTIEFLKSKAPIGARDMITKRFLDKIGVKSFFSGCMTLFLQINFRPLENRDNTIYIADLSRENMKLLPKQVVTKSKFVKHTFHYGERPKLMTKERFVDAYKILDKYSKAKLVITRRIHAALPCVAMGTPVIFFNAPKMPGGGGSISNSSERVAGLVDLFHTIDLYDLTKEQAREKLSKFNWTNPPPNPNLASRMQMVFSMWVILRTNQAIYESAQRFGMLPLTPKWLTKARSGHDFHMIYDEVCQDGGLSWHQMRCIESVLRHHPTSRLFIYSNTIEQSEFDVLTEVGYHVTLVNYQVSDIVQQIPLNEFFNQFAQTTNDDASVKKIMHEHGVLKLLLLYINGGVYLAENTIVLKPINFSIKNVLSLDSESNVNPWMLNFEKNHKFIFEALEMFSTMYNENMKPDNGKALLTKVCTFFYFRMVQIFIHSLFFMHMQLEIQVRYS